MSAPVFGPVNFPVSLLDVQATPPSPLTSRLAPLALPLKALPLPMPSCSSYLPLCSGLASEQVLLLNPPVKNLPTFAALPHSYSADSAALAASVATPHRATTAARQAIDPPNSFPFMLNPFRF